MNILLPGKDEVARVSGIDPKLIGSISEIVRWSGPSWSRRRDILPGFCIDLRVDLDEGDITFEHLSRLSEFYKTRKISFLVDGGRVYDSCAIAGSVEIEVLFEEEAGGEA
jgi:hypothetical protein